MARTATSADANARRRAAAGFTLIELMVVMVILAVAAGVGMAMYGRGAETVSARGAAWDIAAALRGTRARAIRDNGDALFLLDVRSRIFTGPGVKRELPEGVTLAMVGAANERVDREVAGIRFYSDGSSSGGRITVVSGPQTYRIGVDWLTGLVTVGE